MYLSRVEIDVNNRRKIKDLTHAGAYHNWVERSFPNEIRDGKHSRKLWRLDSLNGKKYLIVLSESKPDITQLEQYGVDGSAHVKDYEKFLNSVREGMRARFRIVLNPVVSVSQGKGKRGLVKPHITHNHQKMYLLERAERNGFYLKEEDFNLTERSFAILQHKNHKPIKLVKVTYEGELVVKNKDVFINILRTGFGKKKAYGFGLMSIIPME